MKIGGMGAKGMGLVREATADKAMVVDKSQAEEAKSIIITETLVGLTIKSLKMRDQRLINFLITLERIQGFQEGEDLSHLLKMELQLKVQIWELDSIQEDLLSITWLMVRQWKRRKKMQKKNSILMQSLKMKD